MTDKPNPSSVKDIGEDKQQSAPVDEAGIEARAKVEEEKFAAENELSRVYIQVEKQKVTLRWLAFVIAIVIMVFLVVLEYIILRCINSLPNIEGLVFLAITPIVAVTVLTVSVLVSVFRIPKTEMDNAASSAAKFMSRIGE